MYMLRLNRAQDGLCAHCFISNAGVILKALRLICWLGVISCGGLLGCESPPFASILRASDPYPSTSRVAPALGEAPSAAAAVDQLVVVDNQADHVIESHDPLIPQPLEFKPLPILESHRNRLAHHGGVLALAFGADHELYIATQQQLWFYNFSEQSLKSLELRPAELGGGGDGGDENDDEVRAQFISWGEQAYLLHSGNELFVVEHKPVLRVLKLEIAAQGFMGAGLLGESRSLMTQDSLWVLDHGLRVVTRWGLPAIQDFYELVSQNPAEVKAMVAKTPLHAMRVAYTEDRQLIFYTQRHIWLWQPSAQAPHYLVERAEKSAELRLIGSYFRDIQRIHLSGTEVMVVETPYALILLDFQGRILKMIDVSALRRLRVALLSATEHTYLFDDHRLEIYHPQTHQLWSGVFAFDKTKRIAALVRRDHRVAMAVDGQVKLFELARQPLAGVEN